MSLGVAFLAGVGFALSSMIALAGILCVWDECKAQQRHKGAKFDTRSVWTLVGGLILLAGSVVLLFVAPNIKSDSEKCLESGNGLLAGQCIIISE